MDQPLVSVVSICWNRKADILESLQGVFASDYKNMEVIVVDNHSDDGTPEAIQEQFPQVQVILMPENKGIAAYNIGFQNAKGAYIVILDDDSFPAKDAISKMVKAFEKDKKIGLVAFDVRNYYNYDDVAKQAVDEALPQTHQYLMSFNGAGAGVRRNLFAKAGFYPEEFFLYWNEADVALKILDLGYKIQHFHGIVSYHKFSPKNRTSWRAPYFYTRNMFWLLWKHYPFALCLRYSVDFVFKCFYFSFAHKTWVYLKAMMDAFKGLDQILYKRKPVRRYVWKNMRINFDMSFSQFK